MLRKFLLSLCALLAAAQGAQAADKYAFDKDHTHIIFFISHLGFSHTIGRIKDYDGYFTFDETSPESAEVDVTLKPESVDTSVAKLDKELRGSKFFDVEHYPTMHFKSTKIVVTGKNKGDIMGEFTMLGVVRPLTLHVTYSKSGIHPFTNNYVSGFSADATLKRSDFGMNAYIPQVGDEVIIHLEVEGIDPFKHPGNPKTPG
jgi:polyisoprenoid-binding protein YceI